MNRNSDDNQEKGNKILTELLKKNAPPSEPTTYGSQAVIGSGAVALDLVVIIDTSGSMSDEAVDLSNQIDAAVEKATADCPSDLRVTFLGIQGTWEGTRFDETVSHYLLSHGAKESQLQARAPFKESDGFDHAGNREDLCRAVIDVCHHFDWRSYARKAIFVLGDESMEGGGGTLTQAAIEKNSEAIAVARSMKVKVHTYQGTPDDSPTNLDRFPTLADKDAVTSEYQRLAKETGGRSYIYTTGIANFLLVLKDVLCDSLMPPILPEGKHLDCSYVCEHLSEIISTVNKLADIMNKAIDACCPKTPTKC